MQNFERVILFGVAGMPLLAIVGLFVLLFWPGIVARLQRLRRAATGLPARLDLVALVAVAVLAPVLAWAQAAAAPPIDSGPSWQVTLLSFAATGVCGLIGWATYRFLGIQLDKHAQDNLHRALMTGALAVLGRNGERSAVLDAASPREIVSYVEQSVPDAIARLAPSPDVLTTLATAKLREVASGALAAPRG